MKDHTLKCRNITRPSNYSIQLNIPASYFLLCREMPQPSACKLLIQHSAEQEESPKQQDGLRSCQWKDQVSIKELPFLAIACDSACRSPC